MGVKTNIALAGAFVAALASVMGDTDVSVKSAYCEINENADYPVRVVDAADGRTLREGGFKRFDMDYAAKTCTYVEKTGDAYVYHMKPGANYQP